MWIYHIDEIAIGVFILLLFAHFGLHLFFKIRKRKQKRKPKQHAQKQN